MSTVGVGVIGAGPWGMNLARVFGGARGAELRWICDLDGERLERARAAHPGVRLTRALGDVLGDGAVGAVVVAVDSPRHHAVAKAVLESGRHVLVEKPLALSLADAAELDGLARARGRVLMVGHVLLHHPAILHARAIIASGALGELLYLEAMRVAFGTVRPGESVWWSVAPHDLAVTLYLFDAAPVAVSASGAAYLQPGRPDVVLAALRFADGRSAYLHVSWLAPARRRALTVVGRERMLTFDEGAADRPLEIHARSVTAAPAGPGFVARAGGVEVPALPAVEPLAAEGEHFLACIATGAEPRGADRTMDVMRVLEAGERSVRAGGAPVEVA
jgi:predicted dehydrogenase